MQVTLETVNIVMRNMFLGHTPNLIHFLGEVNSLNQKRVTINLAPGQKNFQKGEKKGQLLLEQEKSPLQSTSPRH